MSDRKRAISGMVVTMTLAIFVAGAREAAAQEFKSIFDGKSLEGWSSKQAGFWRVEGGAITAESTEQNPCTKNTFLVWQLGQVDDFELKLKYRITGSDRANSGIQIRSQLFPDGHMTGYQCDLDLAGNWVGKLYDEHMPRKLLAQRGEKVVFDQEGNRSATTFTNKPDAVLATLKRGGWNDYHIKARGHNIQIFINGVKTIDVTDYQEGEFDASGLLAVQLHSGPPMKVQFKDIVLKRLPLAGGVKKVVMVAGAPSHAPGDHEFNAGVKLLAECLKDNGAVLVANYHDNGFPKDRTAFDNADGIILYMDGGGRHPINDDATLARLAEAVDGGAGLMCMHYAVEVKPGKLEGAFKNWLGGYYEGGWSINPHWVSTGGMLAKGHPVSRGVKPFAIEDEWYYNMRFRDGKAGVTDIFTAVPDDEARSGSTSSPRGPKAHIVSASGRRETLMWAVERPDGGRGVGYTGGHNHENWGNEDNRRMVLNGILWVSGAEVPKGGVKSKVSEKQLTMNLDSKPVRKKK